MPLDLNIIAFTPQKDVVTFADTIDVVSPSFEFAIINEAPVDALGGNDQIQGMLDGTIGDFAGPVNVNGIEQVEDLATGDGRDDVIGKVDFSRASVQQFGAFGISGSGTTPAPFNTGPGNDRVEGHARAEALAAGVFGLANLELDTGDGRDTVAGKAEAVAGGNDAALFAAGIFGGQVAVGEDVDNANTGFSIGTSSSELEVSGRIGDNQMSTGDGNDSVEGKAKIQGQDGAVVNGMGIIAADIDTGSGRDNVTGTIETTVGATSSASSSSGIVSSSIDTGDGNDGVTGSNSVTAGNESSALFAFGLSDTSIDTGSGRDNVEGTTSVEVGENAVAVFVVGINATAIDTGVGNDTVAGHVSVSAGVGSGVGFVAGLDNVVVDTGDGRDRVEGTASVSGDGLIGAAGDGIVNSDINTGAGADNVIGIGADVAIGDSSDGIEDSTISLGGGDDQVMARGASSGVSDVDIFGDAGDDIFDLHSGTGLADGGADNDLLILAGDSGNFTFTNNGGLTGNITDGGVTNLDVANIEQFEFDDGRFDFGDLF